MRQPLRSILPTILVLLLFPEFAGAENFVISTGVQGGNYFEMGRRLEIVLLGEDQAVQVATSEGSTANLSRLDQDDHPVNVIFAQADATRRYLDENPAFKEEIMLVDEVGRECVILVTKAKGGIASAGELKQPGKRAVSVGGPESGAAVTWNTLVRLDPTFGNTELAFVDVLESLLKLRLGGAYTNLAAVMMVSRPHSISPAMEVVLDHPDDFRILPFEPEHLELDANNPNMPKLPDGTPVYHFDTVTSGFGKGRLVTYPTLCTRGLLLTSRKKLGGEDAERLSRIMLENGTLIAPGRDKR